jgi:O-antigen/teichoic acid export membrane protein
MLLRVPASSEDIPLSAEPLDSADAGARFIRGSMVRMVTYGTSLLASLVSAPLVIRHLGPSQYGYFATVIAIVFIIGGFTEGGLNALGVREFASGRPDRDWLLRNLVGLRVSATAVAVTVVAVVTAIFGAPQVISLGVLLGGAGLIVTIAGENYGIPLSAELRLNSVSLLGLVQQIVLAGVYVGLVLVDARTLPFLGATIVSGAVLLGGTALLVRGQVSLLPAFDRREWAALLRQTLPYAMASAVGIVYFREALILITVLANARIAGYYAAAFRIVEVLGAVPWTIISAAFPIFARAAHKEDDERLSYALQRLFDTSLIIGVWMAASIVVGASFAILVVAGPRFAPSVPVLQIQGLAIVTTFMVALFGSVLLSLRLFRALLRANAIAVFVATLLSFVLIPRLGARGAAIAPTAAEACLAVAYAWSLRLARPALRVSLGLVPRVALGTVVSLGVSYALPLTSAERLFVFGGLYAVCLILLRAIPFEVMNVLLRRSPPSAP